MPSKFLHRVMPFTEPSPPHLKALLFYPLDARNFHFWVGSNGARFYFDNANRFPEWATPECDSLRSVLVHSMAGDTVVVDLEKEVIARNVFQDGQYMDCKDFFVFKMNTHFRSTGPFDATGFHENYFTKAEFNPWHTTHTHKAEDFCNVMIPFLVSRQIFDGAGGIRFHEQEGWQYVVSQRMFFINALKWSSATHQNRGLIMFRHDTKEECPLGHTRLHIHCGDVNMSPIGKYIAMGATHLLLRALEEGGSGQWRYTHMDEQNVLSDAYALSNDPTLKSKIRLVTSGTTLSFSAMELQQEYYEFVCAHVIDFSDEEKNILSVWRSMIQKLSRDPCEAAQELDWVIKLAFLRERYQSNFESSKVRFATALYHAVSSRGIYWQLIKAGKIQPFATAEEILAARLTPPLTRAEFRSRFIKGRAQLPFDQRYMVNWGSFGLPESSVVINDPLQRTSDEGERLLKSFDDCARTSA